METVAAIVLTVPREFVDVLKQQTADLSRVRVVEGGAQRWQSVQRGFRALPNDCDPVVIHDVARPFVDPQIIQHGIELAQKGSCVLTALPASDTLKQVDGPKVEKTLDRRAVIQVQTPQFFPRDVLKQTYAALEQKSIPDLFLTDEAGLVEYLGYGVQWIEGNERLRKVTREEDLRWADWMASTIGKGST